MSAKKQIVGWSFSLLLLTTCTQTPPVGDIHQETFQITATPSLAEASSQNVQAAALTSGQRLPFEQISIADGLSQSTVTCIFQDAQGFLWVGTDDGLNRYNGYNFQVFRRRPADPDSISGNSITAITQDAAGDLWVGTQNQGLNRYTPTTGKFRVYTQQNTNLSSNAIIDLLLDAEGRLWILTWVGVNSLDPTSQAITHYKFPSLNYGEYTFHTLFEDQDNNILVGTSNGVYRYNPATQAFDVYSFFGFSLSDVRAIFQDHTGTYWVGTGFMGLYQFNLETADINIHRASADDPGSITSNNIRALGEDTAGRLWIGTTDGVLVYDRAKERFIPYQRQAGSTNILASDGILDIYVDREQIVWFGTYTGGLLKLVPQKLQFAHYKDFSQSVAVMNNTVWAIMEDRQGQLWVGTEQDGLYVLDQDRQPIYKFRTEASPPYQLKDNHVRAVLEDQSGRIWIGTFTGVYVFDPTAGQTQHLVNYPKDKRGLSSNLIYEIFEDVHGTIWIGTEEGLNRYDSAEKRFYQYQHRAHQADTLSGNRVRAITQTENGKLWIGTENGLDILDPETDSIERYLFKLLPDSPFNFNAILSIYEDERGILWVGTHQEGLLRLDPQTNQIDQFTEDEGLPNNVVYGILPDQQGYLWMSTNQGLSRFDPQTLSFQNYTVNDGLQSNEFNGGAYYQSNSGQLFFGGVNGISAFFPDDLQSNSYRPPVILTGLTQGGKALEGISTLETLSEISLRWPNNYIEFEIAALSYSQPSENRYAYQLEGFDEAFVELGRQRQGRYTNLPGGDYTLVLAAANNDGVWNRAGQNIQINIVPPIWQTRAFQVSITTAVVLVVVSVYFMRVREVEKRNRELGQIVAARTQELQETNQRLRAEINERERAEQQLAEQAAQEAVSLERSRLAQELHDSVSQTLFSANLIAEVLPSILQRDPQDGQRRLVELSDLTRSAQTEMRTLLLELRPSVLSETPIDELLEQLVAAFAASAQIRVKADIQSCGDLSPEVKIALYRIVQEALNNIAKHAHTQSAEVCFNCANQRVSFQIIDRGVGFDLEQAPADSMGLGIMKSRAAAIGAALEIHSSLGSGTQISGSWQITKDTVKNE